MDLFEALDDDQLGTIVALGDARRAGTGQAIFRQGDPGEAFYVVIQGSIRIVLHLPDGADKELATLGPRTFFGEMGPIGGKPRGADAIAAAPTLLFELSKEAFLRVLDEEPVIKMRLHAIMARRRSENLSVSVTGKSDG